MMTTMPRERATFAIAVAVFFYAAIHGTISDAFPTPRAIKEVAPSTTVRRFSSYGGDQEKETRRTTTTTTRHHHVDVDVDVSRRALLSTIAIASSWSTTSASAAAAPAVVGGVGPPLLEGVGADRRRRSTPVRVEGIGGGLDLRNVTPLGSDVVWPASTTTGTWECRRRATSVEGDRGQAEVAWRALGGAGAFATKEEERYDVVFTSSSPFARYVGADGTEVAGAVADRAFETNARRRGRGAVWDLARPDVLSYVEDDGATTTTLTVMRRRVEPPSDRGFGSDELYRVDTTRSGGVRRAVRVRRRFRRAYDAEGRRTLEGIEIVNTYRVLDDIAGIEMPTSTTKSELLLTAVSS